MSKFVSETRKGNIMATYKVYKNTSSLYLESNSIETLNTIPIHKWRLGISKALCVSFFFSLFMNSLPSSCLGFLREDNSSDSSNVLEDDKKNDQNMLIFNEHLEMTFNQSNAIAPSSSLADEEIPSPSSRVMEFSLKTEKSIEDIYNFMESEYLSIDGLKNLLDSMISTNGPFGSLYSDYNEALTALLRENKSYEVKFLIVMARDGYTYEQLDYMCAGIVGESTGDGNCYDDAYAVASTLINRSHTAWYVNQYGHNFYSIFKAPGQYEIEVSGNYLKYLGAIDLVGYHAAIDALYSRNSIHKWLQFRAKWVELNCTYETFTTGGNKFIDKMEDYEYVPYPEEEIKLEDVKVFVYHKIN